MAVTRKLPAAAGVCLLAVAVFAVVSPAVANRIPIGAVVAQFGNDYLLVAMLAAVALVALFLILAARVVTGRTEATPPPVERTVPGAPGQALDETLDALPPVRVTERHRRVHARIRRAAVEAISEVGQCSRSAARDRVDAGSWTGDAVAAAFVADDGVEPPGLDSRFAAIIRRDDWFRNRVDSTVRAIETLEEDST